MTKKYPNPIMTEQWFRYLTEDGGLITKPPKSKPEFICSVRGLPCECNKQGCIAKKGK